MNAADRDLQRTPKSWWAWGFVFLFLIHAVIVFWIGDRSKPRPFSSRPDPFLYIATDDRTQQRLVEGSARASPTLFALPNEQGFSGAAWLSYTPPPVQSSNWVDTPRALPLPVNDLGETFTAFAATNQVSTAALLDGLRRFAPLELESRSEAIGTESTVTVSGPLARRTLSFRPPLPSASHTDLLTNTVVEVAVDGNGVVESFALLGECGMRAMDDAALEWARAVRFAALPLRGPERDAAALMRGRLVFTWAIAPPGLTNAATARAN
jgi:hypothetical protein